MPYKDTTGRNWYKDMFSFAKRLEGTIRCTYLTLYDADGNKLFALQGNKYKTAYDTEPGNKFSNPLSTTGDSQFLKIDDQLTAVLSPGLYATKGVTDKIVTSVLAVVQTEDFVDADKVPVQLMPVVRYSILDTIKLQVHKSGLIIGCEKDAYSDTVDSDEFDTSMYPEAKNLREKWDKGEITTLQYIQELSNPLVRTKNKDSRETRILRTLSNSRIHYIETLLLRLEPLLQNPDTTYYIYRWECRWYPTHVKYTTKDLTKIEAKYLKTERLAKALAVAGGITTII